MKKVKKAVISTNKSKNIDLMIDLAINNANHQENVFSGHINKINTLLALEGITVVLLIEKIQRIYLRCIFNDTNIFLNFTGFILIFSSVISALRGLSCKGFKRKPENDYIYTNETIKQNNEEYKEDTLADMKDGYENNRTILENIANFINKSILLYFIGLLAIVIGMLEI